jgi:hypothetical protein
MSEPNENVISESTANDIAKENKTVDVNESANEGADIIAEDVVLAHSEFSDATEEDAPPATEEASAQVIQKSETIPPIDDKITQEPQLSSPVQATLAQEQKASAQSAQQKALSNEEVTGHTANLWKYLPIPSHEPEPVPEYINGTVKFPGSKVVAARVRGKKHKHEGTNCDDWYEVANYERMTFIAVSDGAGSKKFSRIGARESCKAAIGFLVSSFEKLFTDKPELKEHLTLALTDSKCMEACGVLAGVVQQSVIKAHEAVEAAFYSRKTNPEYEKILGRGLQFKDLSGTLLIAVLIPISEITKEHLVISCQIGDGMIAILNSEGEFSNSMKLMGVPDSGDFSGETDFLTSSQMKNIETLQHRTKISRTVVDTVMVMSDGVADDYFPNETQMRRLYFDLIVNGILEKPSKPISVATLTQAQMKLFKRIPDPLVYPWVNDQNVKIPIQYTNRILESTGLTLEDLWKDPTALNLARLELEENEKNTDLSEKLKIWLDNYVERGSFDDRTLVVVTM